MGTLTDYEAGQVGEIAAWKAEEPGRVARALRRAREPLGRLVGKALPGSMVRTIAEKAEAAGRGPRRPPGDRPRGRRRRRRRAAAPGLWRSATGQALAVEAAGRRSHGPAKGAAAGLGGFVTEVGNLPILLAAVERAIRRIGHCYGYRLDTEPERRFVLCVLELSTLDDPAERRARLLSRASRPGSAADEAPPRPSLNGVKNEVVHEPDAGGNPAPGRRGVGGPRLRLHPRVSGSDSTARRVFQERWLRDQRKVTEIAPAPLPGRRIDARQKRRAT